MVTRVDRGISHNCGIPINLHEQFVVRVHQYPQRVKRNDEQKHQDQAEETEK